MSNSVSLVVNPHLTVLEAERYWLALSQEDHFSNEIQLLKENLHLPNSSSLLSLHPFIDSTGILRVSGRESNAYKMAYSRLHSVILLGKHPITKLLIRSEHLRLLHAGTTLLSASL